MSICADKSISFSIIPSITNKILYNESEIVSNIDQIFNPNKCKSIFLFREKYDKLKFKLVKLVIPAIESDTLEFI